MTRTRTLAVVLVVAALVATGPAAALSLPGQTDAPTPEIVTYAGHPSFVIEYDGADADAADAIAEWANASSERAIVDEHPTANTTTVRAPRLHVLGGLGPLLATLRSDPGAAIAALGTTALSERDYVLNVSPNYRFEYAAPVEQLQNASEFETPEIGVMSLNDPDYPTAGVAFEADAERTTMADSRAVLGVDDVSAQGTGVTVAVIDTGLNVADPAGKVFGNGTKNSALRIDNASKNVITGEGVNVSAGNLSAIEDGNGHGTWVASAIAANASGTVHDGIAPNATILAVKALADDGSGSVDNIAEAIRYSADHGADVISLSLGAQLYSQPLAEAVEYAYDNGVQAVVVAAGNSRATRSPGVGTPADVSGVITVGATNGSEPSTAWSAYFSQTSGEQIRDGSLAGEETVDVAAPGMRTIARTPGTDGLLRNSTLSGTSMATPMVSGVLALGIAANSTLADANHTEINASLYATARPVPHAAVAEVGAGMAAADNLIDGTHPEEDQADAMMDAAAQRQVFYQAASADRGGLLPFLLRLPAS